MPWISHTKYAEEIGQPAKYVIKLCSEKPDPRRYPKRIDSRDIKQFSTKKYSIYYEPHNASGSTFPRLIDRAGVN